MKINNQQGIIILTSTGLSNNAVRQAAERFFSLLSNKSVAIITTAADGKENDKYSKLAESQFRELGFTAVDFIDFEFSPGVKLDNYNVMYVCGGNTFKLLKYAREASFRKAVHELLGRGGIYIGVSAGSIILAPTIKAAATIDPDINNVGITDLDGLNMIDFEVHPHYESEEEHEILAYEKNVSYKIMRLTNTQAVIISKIGKEFIK